MNLQLLWMVGVGEADCFSKTRRWCPRHRGGRRNPSIGGAHNRATVHACGWEVHRGVSVCSLSNRAGTECVALVLQALTEADLNATVLSIDGISAHGLISRRAMLEALHRVPVGDQVLPCVGRQSTYLWEDDLGVVHHIEQSQRGEQGDLLMPLFVALGQHGALQAVQDNMEPTERLLAILDDVYSVTTLERVAHSFHHFPRTVAPACQHPIAP